MIMGFIQIYYYNRIIQIIVYYQRATYSIQMKSYFLFTFLIFFCLANTQQSRISQGPSPNGTWRPIQKQAREVPRYFVCGAEINKLVKNLVQPFNCTYECGRRLRPSQRHTLPSINRGRRRRAPCQICAKKPDIHEWTRSNGIRFRMCHFQRWQDQYTLHQHGDWEWQGMKMCPPNQMVSGYQIKISQRDGVNGLLLQCKNPYNLNETQQIMVSNQSSAHQWKIQSSKNGYAIGFIIKLADGYIDGIGFEFTPMPTIYSLDFSYKYTNNIEVELQLLEKRIIKNKNPYSTKKQVFSTKQRSFSRNWINQQGNLRGLTLQKYLSKSILGSLSKKCPAIQMSNDNSIIKSNTTTQETLLQFTFGTTERVIMKQQQQFQIEVAPCTAKIVQRLVYSTNTGIPYIAIIGYSNSFKQENDYFLGTYYGVLSKSIETIADDIAIC